MALLKGPRAFAILLCAALLGAIPKASAETPLEDAVKATYVYKFAPFVSWPTPLGASEPFVICSMGSDRVTALLPGITAGQRIDNHPIQVRAVAAEGDLSACRILYVANDAAGASALVGVRGKPILTITGDGGGAVIQLVNIERHVSFDIDDKLASESGLRISSKLLDLARKVERAPGARP